MKQLIKNKLTKIQNKLTKIQNKLTKIQNKVKRNILNGDYSIVKVDGGLGSVILQYALGLNITQKTGKKVKFDATWFEGKAKDCDKKNSYRLLIKNLFPNIKFDLATKKEIKYYKKHHLYNNKKIWKYNDFVLTNKEPVYFEGYYSHHKYWAEMEEQLQKDLDFSHWTLNDANQKMKDIILNSEYAVGVHIRRGDFVNLGWCCLTKDYYINGIKYIQEKINKKIKLFFFSNDIDYVTQEILPEVQNIDYALVDINNHDTGHFDMYLLSLCKSQIIANSTFSICSALLNKNKEKIIIAPSTWGYHIGKTENLDMYEDIDESIQNPKWTIAKYDTGKIINNKE